MRIAINAALDMARRGARLRDSLADRLDALPAAARGADERLGAARLRRDLQRCIDALPGRYRGCVQLYYLEEAGDCAACGERVGVSRDAFMQRLSRARVMLARCLERAARASGWTGSEGAP